MLDRLAEQFMVWLEHVSFHERTLLRRRALTAYRGRVTVDVLPITIDSDAKWRDIGYSKKVWDRPPCRLTIDTTQMFRHLKPRPVYGSDQNAVTVGRFA